MRWHRRHSAGDNIIVIPKLTAKENLEFYLGILEVQWLGLDEVYETIKS